MTYAPYRKLGWEEDQELAGTSQQALRKPFQVLDEDVKRIRKAWRL